MIPVLEILASVFWELRPRLFKIFVPLTPVPLILPLPDPVNSLGWTKCVSPVRTKAMRSDLIYRGYFGTGIPIDVLKED